MKHWHPSSDRHPRFPPGWWVFPAAFIGLFFWAAVYLIAGYLLG